MSLPPLPVRQKHLKVLPGVLIGVVVRVVYLPDPKHFKLFAAGVLLYIGLQIAKELLKKSAGKAGAADSEARFQEAAHLFIGYILAVKRTR